MNLAATIAAVRFLLAVRDLINATLAAYLAKQNADDLAALKKALNEYEDGKTLNEKFKAADKIKDLFNSSSDL